jgi:hypothetical protein
MAWTRIPQGLWTSTDGQDQVGKTRRGLVEVSRRSKGQGILVVAPRKRMRSGDRLGLQIERD